MSRLALLGNFTKYKTEILCLYKTSFLHKQLVTQAYTKINGVIMKYGCISEYFKY